MEKPTLGNIKQWRKKYKLTGEAWDMYASIRTDQMNVGMAAAGLVGLVLGYYIGGM